MTAITISAISPNTGSTAGGQLVTITGQYLYTITHITVGGAEASDLGSGSRTSVTCKTPTHAEGIVDVIVTGNSGFTQGTLANGYTYTPTTTTTPSMHIESMKKTAADTADTDYGAAADTTAGRGTLILSVNNSVINAYTTVTFGGTNANIDAVTRTTTSVTVTVPEPLSLTSSSTVEVTLKTALTTTPTIVDGNSSRPYTYVATPTIGTVIPSGGSTTGLNTVTITGTNLLRTPIVNFGVKPATIVGIATDGNSLTCIVPPGTVGDVNVSVTSLLGVVVTKLKEYTYRTPDTTMSTVNSTCYITLPTTATPVIANETIVASKTASNEPIAKLTLSLKTADGTDYTLSVSDMIILDISGAGLLSAMNNGPIGKFIIDKATTYYVYADGNPGVGTITVTVNGVNLWGVGEFNGIATKTVTFHREPAKIVLSFALTGATQNYKTGSKVKFNVGVSDAAGNALPYNYHRLAKFKDTITSTIYDASYNTTDTNTKLDSYTVTMPTVATATAFTFVAYISELTTTTVNSNAVSGTAILGVPGSFTTSLDKASYKPGEIAVLTVGVKDMQGYPFTSAEEYVLNSFTVAALTLTLIGTINNKSNTYRFTVGNTVGDYKLVTNMTTVMGNGEQAITADFKIADVSGGGVSNADVLKAIVSLIASINKQIAAASTLRDRLSPGPPLLIAKSAF
jgi:hypothetical protein